MAANTNAQSEWTLKQQLVLKMRALGRISTVLLTVTFAIWFYH